MVVVVTASLEVVVVDLGDAFDEEHAAKRRLKATSVANARHGRICRE